MALNIKLRNSVVMTQVAHDVLDHGGFSYVGNRFYYSYVNRAGTGIILFSTDGGRSWHFYDNLGPIKNMSARGPWVGWSEGGRGVLYDINQQWRVADAYPSDPESNGDVGHVIPLPEINAIHYSQGSGSTTGVVGGIKRVGEFGIWDAPSTGIRTGYGGFTTVYNTFIGVYGDQQIQGSGLDRIYEAYLTETYYLGSPSRAYISVIPRTGPNNDHGSLGGDNEVPQGEYLLSSFGLTGFEGTLDGVSGLMGSQRRGPPGLGTHGRGIPIGSYSIRMAGGQVGLRNFSDIYGEESYEWAHGGAWVDEYNVVAASGAIGGYAGLLFRDSAGNIVMVRRSGSQFGAWSEAKVYGNPGFAPSALWLPHAYATVRGGVYGRGEAWFIVDDKPSHIPRGRLVAGDYLPPLASEAMAGDHTRKVTFW